MNTIRSKTILFITGAFVTHHCWDDWVNYFQEKGYTTFAPPWPNKDAPPEELRKRHPYNTALASLTLPEVIEYFANTVKGFDEKPIVIGHSLGGMITQIIVNRNLAAMGIAIHSVPTLGIIPYEPSFLKAGWKSLGLFTSLKKTYLMSFKDWQYAFVNGMPLEDQKAAYEKFTIPESKRVTRGGLTSAAKVNYNKPHPPLLLLSGGEDNIIPAHLNKRNYNKYKRNGSVLEYKEFPDRNHFVLGLPNWREEADFIAHWIEKQSQITKDAYFAK